MTPKTLFLRERRPRDVRLTRADVAVLLAEHRGRFELLPTAARGRYRLTARGVVGTLALPTRRLVVRPKIPSVNLFHLLDPEAPPDLSPNDAAARSGTDALDFLAFRLGRLLAERAAAGLVRGYVETTSEGAYLRGRLDVPAQQRAAPARKDTLHGVYDDFTVDISYNRVPRAVAELVLRSPLVGEAARAAVRRGLAGFEEVTPAVLGPDAFLERPIDAYRPLLTVCRLLADALTPGTASGEDVGPGFLLDIERVYEDYLARVLKEGLAAEPGLSIAVQKSRIVNVLKVALPDLEMRPDVLVSRDGRPAVVVDAKWKGLDVVPPRADVSQVVAYAAGLGAGHAVLVYPGRRDAGLRYHLVGSPLVLTVRTLRVVGRADALRRSARRLARAVISSSRPRCA